MNKRKDKMKQQLMMLLSGKFTIKSKVKFFFFTVTLIGITSCGNKDFHILPTLPESTIISKNSKSGEWDVLEIMTKEGSVYFKEEKLSSLQIELIEKKQDDIIKIEKIPVDEKFNTQIFRIANKELQNVVFVAPKIFSFLGTGQSRKAPTVNNDGTLTLFFPIMLIDGLSTTVPSPMNRFKLIEIPNNLLIQKQVELNDFISKKYGEYGNQTLSKLPGCPKEILITIANKQFHTSFESIKGPSDCSYNVPILTSIRLPENEALWLLQKGLYAAPIDITATFDAKIPYIISKFTIEINKSNLIQKISDRIQLKKVYPKKELLTIITEIVSEQVAGMNLQENSLVHLNGITSQVIDFLFEEIILDSTTNAKKCGKEVDDCLKLKDVLYSNNETFSVNWVQTKDFFSDQNIMTSAQLVPSKNANLEIENLKDNEDSKNDTGLVIVKKDLIDLKLIKLTLEKYIQEKTISTTHNNVQIGTNAVQVCSGVRHSPFKIGSPLLAPSHRRAGGENPICRIIHTPVYADQWVEKTIYTVKKMSTEEQLLNKEIDHTLENLVFVFSWFENGEIKSKRCAANLFNKNVEEESLFLKITNVPQCEIFNLNSTNEIKFSVKNSSPINKIALREGISVTNWKGETSDLSKTSQYDENISYFGKISISGYNLINSEEFF